MKMISVLFKFVVVWLKDCSVGSCDVLYGLFKNIGIYEKICEINNR